MTRLSQIIAVEAAVTADAERALAEARRELSSPERLNGMTKTHKPIAEEGGEDLPGKFTQVQVRVDDVLAGVQAAFARLFDVRLTKDAANATAAVDLRVGGQVLLAGVPVTYMLFLERQLGELAGFVGALPLLDPAEEWGDHPDDVSGLWRSKPRKTERVKQEPRSHVAYPHTPEHPAQVIPYQENIVTGHWTTVEFSGAMPAAAKRAILDRIRILRDAAKYAREEGNATVVEDREAGNLALGYLFGGTLPASAASA